MNTNPDLHSRIVKRGWYWDCKAEGREPDAEVRARLAQISAAEPDAEAQAEQVRPAASASAIRGLVFGCLPSLLLWGLVAGLLGWGLWNLLTEWTAAGGWLR